ncbi:MAG: hypothetical protein OXI50_16285 [Gammaproteobacteria bacterium]|nr:hypothetical protein [Gammaproteobacteria bacterium]
MRRCALKKCGKPLPADANPRRKYCEAKCRYLAYYYRYPERSRKHSVAWAARNREYLRQKAAQYRAKNREVLARIARNERIAKRRGLRQGSGR